MRTQTDTPLPDLHTLVQLWDHQYAHQPVDTPFLYTGPTQASKAFSRKEVNAFGHCLAAYFISQGMQKGDRVLLFAINGPVYLFYELALQIAGLVNVTVDHDTTPEHLQRIYEHVKPRTILVPSYEEYRAHKAWLDAHAAQCPILCEADPEEEMDESDQVTVMRNAMEFGKIYWRENLEQVQARKQSVGPADIASIVYDTRTEAAHHRGVVLSQQNFMQGLASILTCLPHIGGHRRMLSILSNAYLLQRLYAFYVPLATGMDLYCSRGATHYFSEVRADKPKAVVLVPDLLLLLRTEAQRHFRRGRWLRRRYYEQAFRLAYRVLKCQHAGQRVAVGQRFRYWLAQYFIIRPVRRCYFGNLHLLLCDRQGLTEELEYYCHALRLPLVTGFGLNETTGVLAINPTPAQRPLSAGQVVPGLELKPDEKGSLRVRGPLLMAGYWQEPKPKGEWLTVSAPVQIRIQQDWIYLGTQ